MTILFVVIACVFLVLVVYLFIIRPRTLRWGSTDEEVGRTMPGDEIVTNPTYNATRAVSVNAIPEHIWPWIVQMGFKRAGWYAIDLLDNFGKPSATEILPQFQRVEIGDHIPVNPSKTQGFWVKDFRPNKWLLWWNKNNERETWLWVLDPLDDTNTRLITRVRIRYKWFSPWIPFYLLLDVADIVMVRKCMLGIKQRAESLM